MFDFLQDTNFTSNRQHNKHHLFTGLDLTRPTWEEILQNLNRNIVSQAKMKFLDNLGFVLLDAENISCVNSLLEEIKNYSNKKCSAHCYISLLEISKTFGPHNDNADVFFWQVQGSTKWKVHDTSKVYEYTLLPNDIIYIPRFMVHEVVPLGPRAGISIGIDY